MTNSEIYRSVSEFLEIVEQGKDTVEQNEKYLILALDCLALAYSSVAYKFDETDFPDPPKIDAMELRSIISKRFPNYGLYNLPCEITTKIGETEIIVGDAIDDIADITTDMQEIKWRWNNTSIDDALWHFRFGYRSHWGNHLRNLQFYLYAKECES